LLLERVTRPVAATLEHLVGLQGQVPKPPYVGLWTRLERFRREDLTSRIEVRFAEKA